MPRKLRRAKVRRDPGQFTASVVHFLDSGEIAVCAGDNPWMQLSLMDHHAAAARAAWLRGDEAGTREALAQCPGRPGWFVA